MASPEKKFRIGQIKQDVEGLYDVVDGTRKMVATISETQRHHGLRMGDMQLTLNTATTKLGALECRMDRFGTRIDAVDVRLSGLDVRLGGVEIRLDGIDSRLTGVEGVQRDHTGRLDRLEQGQLGLRGTVEGLDTKMDKLLALLTAEPE